MNRCTGKIRRSILEDHGHAYKLYLNNCPSRMTGKSKVVCVHMVINIIP
jgi:hypothetical protein